MKLKKFKLAYISDFFEEEIPGGAEKSDSAFLSLISNDFDIDKIKSSNFMIEKIVEYDFFIISNFTMINPGVSKAIQSKKYILIEHDHKYLRERHPTNYKDFIVPKDLIINQSLYKNAVKVILKSEFHKEVVNKNLNLDNILVLNGCFWSKEDLSILRKNINFEKQYNSCAIESSNPIKGFNDSLSYCKDKSLDYKIIPKGLSFEQFISAMSKFERLVFLPSILESYSRIVMEAKVLGLKVLTRKNLLGAASTEGFSLSGEELLVHLETVQEKNAKLISGIIKGSLSAAKQELSESITVILNGYRRPYNLPMQIDSIKNQSIKPEQVWLWINDHEDNRNIDFSNLGLDKVFKNDYNWKFYGRFAAALLADTEYVAIFDDDTVPGENWFKNCLEVMKEKEGILGSAGVILNSERYMLHDRCGWPTMNEETEEVDLVGHAWFFKREWLQYLWREKPFTWDNGEDIQFSYLSQKYGNIKTYCPPHPKNDLSMHGSILGNELGIDSKATSNNNEVTHEQFFTERDHCVKNAIDNGWSTVKKIKS